ncbi:serpin family protein, partial [Saccharomonospora iraqiensis]|uniref:serpin family protein n=1 Tax=Saccharomonospora iraqiensis TaxID=52698 RepID=UPI00022E1575
GAPGAADVGTADTGSAEPDATEPDATETVAELAGLLRTAAELDPAPEAPDDPPKLAVSNRLWVWRALAVRPGFPEELATWPGGTVATALFPEDPEDTRAEINADVARTTRDLIPELLPPGSIDGDTVAGLVNALYLRVAWTYPFRADDTGPGDFHGPSGTRQVPMMRQTETLGYAEHAGWRLVTLPAVGGVRATVLLPDRPLAEQEPGLDADTLAELLAAERQARVELTLPRLTLDTRGGLRSALASLGVRTMFRAGSDFGELSDDPRLTVSDVLHESVLRVDESGLEGAAATAATMRLVSAPSGQPVTVTVDRPFLLLVRHAATGVVYFLARVVEP